MWGDIGPVDRSLKHETQTEKTGSGMAITTFVVVAFSLLCVRAALIGPWLLLDVDLGWHLGYGEWIVEHFRLPQVDQWSWTRLGERYQLTQWGGEVLLGLANLSGGSGGLLLLNSATVAATLGWMFALASRHVSIQLAILVTGTSGFMLFAGVVRPTMFSWLLAAGLASMCVTAATSGSRWTMVAIPVLIAIWTNIHGSFALGTASAMLFWLCMGVVYTQKGQKREALLCIGAAVLVAAATLFNPYGWRVWEAVIAVANLETTRSRYFGDWKATEIASGLALPAWLAVLSAVTVLLRGASRWQLLACAGVVALSLSAQRNAGIAAVSANAVVCLALSGSWLDRKLSQEAARGKPSGWLWPIVACAGSIASCIWLANVTSSERMEKAQGSLYPVICKIGLANLNGLHKTSQIKEGRYRLLNEFEHGGWWQRHQPNVLVSIDGRADLFGDQAYLELEMIKKGLPGWEQVLERMQPDVICLNGNAKLFSAKKVEEAFELKASDDKWSLWIRRKALR